MENVQIEAVKMNQMIEMPPDMYFLIVDDSPTIREALAGILKTLGYRNINLCIDAGTALEIMKRQTVGLVICNRNLRQVSGMEFLKEIRETPEIKRAPFMMMASEIPKEDVMFASELGVDGYLKIPFVMRDVSTRISGCIARYREASNLEIQFEEARLLYVAGKFDAAKNTYQTILKSAPRSARVRVGLARALKGMDKMKEAEEVLLEAIKVNAVYVHAHHELGMIYLHLDKIDMALKYFDSAIHLSPSNPIRYETISDLLMRNSKFKEAEDYLMKAVKLELAYPVLFAQLGKSLFSQKKVHNALKFFEKALVQQPDNTSFMNSMGICMKEIGRFEEAVTCYNRALKLRPSDTKILFNKALCFLQMKEYDRSRKTLNQILKVEPDFEKAAAKLKEIDRIEASAVQKAS